MKLKKILGIKSSPRRKKVSVSKKDISNKELCVGLTVRSRYVLKELLGEGSFGEVWLAHDKLTDIQVALKFFKSVDNESLDKFTKEYTLLEGLSHPNILSAHHFDKWGSRPFIVMKYCPGGTAESKCGTITEPQLWKLIHDVASGLAYLHSLPTPIVHQDLKPSNIMIDDSGNFMISDFGISKSIESAISKMSARAVGAGCMPYMAPERFSENPLPILASDIWSLGASLYELATGEVPFGFMGGVAQNNGAETPDLGKNWSDNLNQLIKDCIAKETWNRPKASEIAKMAQYRLLSNPISIVDKVKNNNDYSISGINDDVKTQSFINESNSNANDPSQKYESCQTLSIDLGCDFVDLGLSVKWSDRFWGASDQYGLGKAIPIRSRIIKIESPSIYLPTISNIKELLEICEWRPRRLGRTIVGYHVIGPNGNSIYFPFVEVQSNSQKVSRTQWRSLEKTIYFPAREEIEDGETCKCKIGVDGADLSTSIMISSVHLRMVKPY